MVVHSLPLIRFTKTLQTELAPAVQQGMEQCQGVDSWQRDWALEQDKTHEFRNDDHLSHFTRKLTSFANCEVNNKVRLASNRNTFRL